MGASKIAALARSSYNDFTMTMPHLGSCFYKADFHNHSPASKDFADRTVTPEAIIEAAAKQAIDIFAITDHNTAEWVDRLQAASKGSTVTIIPGVEITTPEGHILALFEPGFEGAKITDLLIKIGIKREVHGKEEAISEFHAEEVLKEIQAVGGIAIAAHANSDNGLLRTKGHYKFQVFKMV
ncbi:MAG: PHP domain-containing protein, partial [Nitrososphaera sp.]|nr:PHP domain-containing protein [Nitrososphaera sp.]